MTEFAITVYRSQADIDCILEVSSSMDIGEHPASVKGKVWIFTNADSVKMYKNDKFIKEYFPHNEYFSSMAKSPILIDDYIGDILESEEKMPPKKAKYVAKALNYIGLNGYTTITPTLAKMALKCMTIYRMSINQIVDLYTKYVGDWGGQSTVYRFDAIKNGKIVKSVTKTPMSEMHLEIAISSNTLTENNSYDMAVIRISALDENGNLLPYCNEAIKVSVDGPLQIVGPDLISLRGGMTGVYVKTMGEKGSAKVIISCPRVEDTIIDFKIN